MMCKVKVCGLMQPRDIQAANQLRPDYVGFVFVQTSRRFLTKKAAVKLRSMLHPDIKTVGVFVDAKMDDIAAYLHDGVIDIAQLHGAETKREIQALRSMTGQPIIKAFRVQTEADILAANCSTADAVLLDSGSGSGRTFDWCLLQGMTRPYFLAGGLDMENVRCAVQRLHPYAVDVSSGIETDGQKDPAKMRAFINAVRQGEKE